MSDRIDIQDFVPKDAPPRYSSRDFDSDVDPKRDDFNEGLHLPDINTTPMFINIGPTPMVAPLVEITRPRRDDQAQLGFARSDALIGLSPAPTARLLENDRMTVSYTAIAPGGDAVLGAQRESAVCVIDGGELRGERGDVTTVAARTGSWRGAGQQRVVNVGSTTYRELSVELK